MRIVSLVPAATEIAAALGLMDEIVGVSHECDYPSAANQRPRVTYCPIHRSDLPSRTVDEWVRSKMHDESSIYVINERLLRELQPDVILSQKLCDVCAVGYGTVIRLAAGLAGPPTVVNLEPSSLSDIFDDIRRVATVCGVNDRAEDLIQQLAGRVELVSRRTQDVRPRKQCFLMEWVDPPFCSGHWGPELVELAGGYDPLGRKHKSSRQMAWEQVLEANPEVIVLALCGYDVARGLRDAELLRTFPGFHSLAAARNDAIYAVDAGSYFARPGPRIVDSLEILAGILHPGQFPEFTLEGRHADSVVRVVAGAAS